MISSKLERTFYNDPVLHAYKCCTEYKITVNSENVASKSVLGFRPGVATGGLGGPINGQPMVSSGNQSPPQPGTQQLVGSNQSSVGPNNNANNQIPPLTPNMNSAGGGLGGIGGLPEEIKPRSLRFTWSMKTTSSLAPEQMMQLVLDITIASTQLADTAFALNTSTNFDNREKCICNR